MPIYKIYKYINDWRTIIIIIIVIIIKKELEKYKKEIPGNIKIHQPSTTEDHTTWNISHPKKGTLHQIDFYLILTLGPRNGLGYYVVLWYYIREDSNNDNNYTFDVLLKRSSTLLHRYYKKSLSELYFSWLWNFCQPVSPEQP